MHIQTFLVIVIVLLLVIYIAYLKISKRILWERYQIERIRRGWEFVYSYYQTHPGDINILSKEDIIEDNPSLAKVFEDSTKDDIIRYIKECDAPLLPYLDNIDRCIDTVLYDGRPPLSSTLCRRFIKWSRHRVTLDW